MQFFDDINNVNAIHNKIFTGLCCLVVEDNPFAQDIMNIFLQRHGFCVDDADNGQIALDKSLAAPDKFTVVQCAPAVRVAIAEDFGAAFGTIAAGKLAAALRRLGFDKVYDTNFAADVTIMEEGSELIDRVKNGGTLPMFTSCCPAWVRYVETKYPQLRHHLSTCKSPQQMEGALMKTYGAKINKVPAEKIYSVSIMPCTCKEFECERPEMNDSGQRDVDVVLTTRELVWLIKDMNIDWNALPDEKYD